jgi:adenylosuccinate lyase
MPSHVIDSIFFRDLFGSPAMRGVFDDHNLLQKWLDYEAALARAEARCGLIPRDAADEITRQARAEWMDTKAIKAGIDKTVHPLVSVIWQLSQRCEGDAGRYVHWGATTQDVMDSAIVLQIREALALIDDTITRLIDALHGLAQAHRHTPIAGRTHGQQALPTTFGFKVAVWLAEMQRHRERLQQLRPRLLVGQFGGAVGTLAGLVDASEVDGLVVQGALMEELGLGVPLIAWHTSRDGIAEFAVQVGMMAALMGRIANEIIHLQKIEFSELEEPFEMGKVGSSTMPQKRNPMLCEAVLTLARLCREKVATAIDTLLYNEHERDWSSVQMEWAYLPELCVMAHGAMELTLRVLSGLHVDAEQMRRNLDLTQGLLLAERVMLELGKHIGRQNAHDVVYERAMHSVEHEQPFLESLVADERVTAHVDRTKLAMLLDPEQYIGLAAAFVDRVLQATPPDVDRL